MVPQVGLGTEGPVQRGWSLWIVSVVGVLLAALFVAARLAQRYFYSKFWVDDYMVVASLIFSGLLTMCVCQGELQGVFLVTIF